MKLCSVCKRINPDSADECIGCGGTAFEPIKHKEQGEDVI